MKPTNVTIPAEIISDQQYSINEICDICQLETTFVFEMIEFDVITPLTPLGDAFSHEQIDRIMRAWRLHRDLELNSPGIALVMQLLEQIEQQQKELKLFRLQAV